jgi:hypothetical protein
MLSYPLPVLTNPARSASSAMRQIGFILGGIVWLGLISAGSSIFLRHESAPGPDRKAPAEWPQASAIRRAPGQAALLMFVHPECPCTRASLSELRGLMAEHRAEAHAYVLVLDDAALPQRNEQSEIWQTAAAIPGVTVQSDQAGAEAAIFAAATSGRTVLYDVTGRLLFAGGITQSRGHLGDSEGLSAIAALLEGSRTAATESPVFGCPLFDTSRACAPKK